MPLEVSLAASARPYSYTFSESLLDKAPDRGLAAGTHLVVHRDNVQVLAWGKAMPGARVVGEQEPYVLLSWDEGAADPTLAAWGGAPPQRIPTEPFRMGGTSLPPGVAPPPARAAPELPILPPPSRE